MLQRLFPTAILVILVCSASVADAQRYRWVDEKGRAHYSDNPPAGAKGVTKIETKTESAAEEGPPLPFAVQQAQKDFPVTLYTAPSCKELCEQARAALNQRGVPFTEFQVWNAETIAQLKSKVGSNGVPALSVGRSVMAGFEQTGYDSLLDSAGYPKQGAVPARAQRAPAPPEGYEGAPAAKPQQAEAPGPPAGPYDTSGLPSNRSDKPGPYDPSGLPPNRSDKPGRYLAPDSAK